MKVYEYIIRLKDQATDKISLLANVVSTGKSKVDAFSGSLNKASSASDLLSSSLTRWLGPAALIAGLTLGVTKASALSREFEQTRISYEVMIGSVKQGRALLAETERLAILTPFKSSDLQASGKLLLGYGISAQKVIPTIKMLGDISGGNAEKLHYLSLAYAQTQAAGRLMGQDLLQMVNAGFNPLKTISDKTGISIGVLKKQMEEGAISAEIIEKAFKAATSEGGRFFGMMDKQSQTFEGRMNALAEKTEILMRGLGNGVNMFLSPVLDSAIEKLDLLMDKSGKLGTDATKQADHFRNLQTNIKPLIDEYLKLRDASKLTGEEQLRMKNITGQIAQAIPMAVEKWDAYGNALKINSVDAGFYIRQQEELFQLQNKNAQDEIIKELNELEGKRVTVSKLIQAERDGKLKTDSNKWAGAGLAELATVTERETVLQNQLLQLRNDKVKSYLKKNQSGPSENWNAIGEDIMGKGKSKKEKDGTDKITGGGKQAINVTINISTLNGIGNIEKVNGEMEINTLIDTMKKAAMEKMIEVVNSANYAQAQ